MVAAIITLTKFDTRNIAIPIAELSTIVIPESGSRRVACIENWRSNPT